MQNDVLRTAIIISKDFWVPQINIFIVYAAGTNELFKTTHAREWSSPKFK